MFWLTTKEGVAWIAKHLMIPVTALTNSGTRTRTQEGKASSGVTTKGERYGAREAVRLILKNPKTLEMAVFVYSTD